MPEPPSTLSPAAGARINKSHNATNHAASAQANLPHAGRQVEQAQKAVIEPKEQAAGQAARNVASGLAGRQPPSLAVDKLCHAIIRIINGLSPEERSDLVDAKPDAMQKAAGVSLERSVDSGVEQVHRDGYSALEHTPVGVANQQHTDITAAPSADSTPPASAGLATPDAIPAKNVDLSADTRDSQSRLDQAGMETAPAKLAQTGPIAEARAAQGELVETAAEDPAKVLAAQSAALAKAGSDMAALEQSSMAMLHTARKVTASNVHGQKKGMVVDEETMRRQAGIEAQKIFNKAQSDVNLKVADLKPKAMAYWKAEVDGATTKFKDELKRVAAWIKHRHSGLLGRTYYRAKDALLDLPDEVQEWYDDAEIHFAVTLCKTAREISSRVNTIVADCEARIAQASAEIDGVYSSLPNNLTKWADGQKKQFGAKLSALADHARAVRDDFDKELVQSATATMQDVHDQVQDLREKAKGLLSRIGDAISAFLKDPAKFIINAILSILGISPGAFWALVEKIKHVIKQIADDPVQFARNLMSAIGKGFSQFFGRFATHLFKGFIKWLTGGLAAVGVEVPSDLSLPSILTFMLQLMGLTWPRIRERLAKQIGEKNVALIDKAFSVVAKLIELGPAGIFELIKQQLNPQNILDMIINAAVAFMETAIVKAVAEKVARLFIPGGAILEAIMGIYKVLKWIVHNAANIFTLIDTIVSGIADILSGNVGGMANAIEKALALLIPPVIDFIADFFGLGDIPNKVKDVIAGLQEKVLSGVDKVIGWMIEKGKGLLAAVGIGKKEEPHKGPDARTDEDKTLAKQAAVDEAVTLAPKEEFDEETFQPTLLSLKSKYRLISLELTIETGAGDAETLTFTAMASSKVRNQTSAKGVHVTKVKIPSRRSWESETLTILAEESEELHKKDRSGNVRRGASGTPLLKKGYARRHIFSSKDMAEHYEETLNGIRGGRKTLAQAKKLLEETGCDAARAAGKVQGKLSNKAILEAAKRRHAAFFNCADNHFVGPSKRNSQIGRNLDPDSLDREDLQIHVDTVKAEWALDLSVSIISGAKGLVED